MRPGGYDGKGGITYPMEQGMGKMRLPEERCRLKNWLKIPVASLNTGHTGSVGWRKTLAGWIVQTGALLPSQWRSDYCDNHYVEGVTCDDE